MTRQNVYLKPDEKLHSSAQVRTICDDIVNDYRARRITYKKAMDRLTELGNLIIPRTEALKGKDPSEAYVSMAKLRLRKLHG